MTARSSGKSAGKVRTEPSARLKKRAAEILRGLRSLYPDSDCALHHMDPLQLLVATILSAQCTDERVNQVTPALFRRYPTAADYAAADPDDLSELIRPTGFFRNKTKSLIGLGIALARLHAGKVPDEMDQLVKLPGVGRKTANVVLGTWFGKPAIPVDTHVIRLVDRLGLSGNTDPVKIEYDLQRILPEKDWTFGSQALIWHGRRVCKARRPDCDGCELRLLCPYPSRS